MMGETMVQDERNTAVQYSVSSNAYYGYVPLTVRDNQQDSWNPWRSCRLEAADWNRQLHNSQQFPREDIGDGRRCLKRRRDFTSQERPLGLKRFRGENSVAMPTILTVQEVQNSMDWTCNNSAEALDVDLDAVVCTGVEQSSSANESCLVWAAGNSSSISKPDYKHLSPSNDSKSDNSSDEYEKLLFTTHGCTVYHQQRVNHMEI